MEATQHDPTRTDFRPAAPLRLLVVEDDPTDADRMRVVLQRCCSVAAYHVVDQPTSLERHLRTSDYDVILSDHDLGAWVGLEALQLVQRLGKDIPFIVVTATLGDEAAVEYIKRGASHYVLKTHLEDLPTAIHQALLEKAARGAAAKLWEQLQQANREWEQVFNTVPDPVLVLDEDCRIRRANEAAASILGVGVPEMLGRPCHEVVHGRSEPLPSCPHQLLINGGTAQSGDVEEKRLGKIFHSSTAPLRDSNGILRGCVHVLRDVTHRKRAEQALRLSEEKFESVFRSSPDAIALTTLTEGRFLDVNHQFDRLTGYRREEVLGRTAVDLGFWQDVKDRAGLIAAASDKGMLRDFERQLRVKSGKLRTVAFSGEVIEWAGQQCLVAVLHDVTARKQAEAALRREALTFENMYDAVLVVNKDGTIADCNPAATRLFGYQKTELLGHTVSILHGAGHATLLHSTIPAELDSVGRWEGELPFVRKDGSKGTCETVIVPLRDEHGNRIAGIGVSRDVTERKHTEQALRESELQMRLLLDSTAEAIFGLDLEGRCTFCNPACLRMLGYNSPEELLGKNMHGTMHHTRADGTPCPIHDCHIYRSLWQQVPIHIQDEVLWRANGTSFPAEYWSYPIRKRGEVVGCVVTFLDISERKRAQKALQESEEKYRVLVENATYGIFRSTADGKILDVNPAFVAMLGYDSKEEVLSLNLDSDIYQNSDNRQEILRSYGKEPRRVYAETELRRKDGSGITVRMKGRVVHGVDPKSEWYEAIAEDVTQQRSLEAQFRQSQKMEAVGRLAGGIAHDFNNILMIINSCAELILGTASSDANTQRYAEQIIQAGGKAASLTAQLLAFSRKQILQPTILDLGAVVTELGMMLPRVLRRDIEMSIFVDSQLGKVNADRAQIEQVLMNLAVNARDAMPKGGKLQIEVRNAEVDSAYVQRRRQVAMGRYVVLAVSDTGVGMDPETQASIFEPFFTTKGLGKGTGLGLSTVYGIVKQSGGFIWSYSEPGLGSTFKVYLPRVDPAADAAPLAEEETGEGQVGHGKIVLLVDDESDLRSAVREFLEAKGYLVLEAENGTQALEVCHRHRSSIAVLLTDLIMPGMSGAELAAHICSVNPDVKTIYMSGYMDRSKYVENLGPDAVFLQKPFSLKTLARKLQSAVQPSPNPGKTGTSSATGPQD